jgi:mannose-6-phosphate isomerase-like protein (cupin superfamily)
MSNNDMLRVKEISHTKKDSVSQVKLSGLGIAVLNRVCTLRYKVLHGEGLMCVEDDIIELRPGVEVTVLPGQRYQDVGHLTMLATSEPPFMKEQVEVLEAPLLPISFSDEILLASHMPQTVV